MEVATKNIHTELSQNFSLELGPGISGRISGFTALKELPPERMSWHWFLKLRQNNAERFVLQ
jgi:hypothetical protein